MKGGAPGRPPDAAVRRPGPVPLETATDARLALDVWQRLVRDERVHRAFAAGRHRELAESLGLGPEEVAILDAFAARPGTRWNVENIRYRATLQVSVRLEMWMPMSVRLLTGGHEDWLRDLVFEYLTLHEWDDLGPYALTECERFAAFVRERVMLRRPWNARLEPVLAFELAVVGLLKRTRDVPAEAWPDLPGPALGDETLRSLRPRHGPVVQVVKLPIDVTPWLENGGREESSLRDQPTSYLLYVPSLRVAHRVQTIGEGAELVFESCTGESTVAELAARLEAEHGVDPAGVHALIRRWIENGALVA
jgi:hypothetical protein